jgi:hypothetical protein
MDSLLHLAESHCAPEEALLSPQRLGCAMESIGVSTDALDSVESESGMLEELVGAA